MSLQNPLPPRVKLPNLVLRLFKARKILLRSIYGRPLSLESQKLFFYSNRDQERTLQINWKHIRTLNGSQSEGFEEFCSQLARREVMLQRARFTS